MASHQQFLESADALESAKGRREDTGWALRRTGAPRQVNKPHLRVATVYMPLANRKGITIRNLIHLCHDTRSTRTDRKST